ncbi:Eco57I restriction-modification methylase domain-containing protein [Streptomyces sp. NPDC059017]|uniref:Eco57I restriction-modification methylase domain-containing protein n=1 Tax=Streptomyces sp. NPDC059017 TaxID=3346700 RepID=UPI0036B1C646
MSLAKTVVTDSVLTVGGLLPPDTLTRIRDGKDVPGAQPSDYGLFAANDTVRDAAERSWSYLKGVWAAYQEALAKEGADRNEGIQAVGVTVERWLLPLFEQLGYGRLPDAPAGGLPSADGEKRFEVSHVWQGVPVHLTGWNVQLDGRGAVPQSLLQEYLNRSGEQALWGLVSNGRLLRLLRDSTSMVGSAYVEFDVEAVFEGDRFADFLLLWRLTHRSRFEPHGEHGAAGCWLEKWRTEAIASGTRALNQLRLGVEKALVTLGSGFIAHPANTELRERLHESEVTVRDMHPALLHLVYRLLFLFVAEDRGLLIPADTPEDARERYEKYFSTARLRRTATRRTGSPHGDQWHALSLVLKGLGAEGGLPELGLPGLGGLFERTREDEVLEGLELPNEALFTAVKALSVVIDPKLNRPRRVDYRHLGAEELGSIYESLLELVPRFNPAANTFELRTLAGNERKTTGSYYTPSSLIDCLLDSALDPVIDDAVKSGTTREEQEAALLRLTVCDPACGSGHFLVAAARRIAKRLAAVRYDTPEPSAEDTRTALRDVIGRCIYGVDLNPMAVELAKVSLWIESLEPGKPLSFLDSHVKRGNGLLGTTPKLVSEGLPDEAFKPIQADDSKWVSALKKRNKEERSAWLANLKYGVTQGELFSDIPLRTSNSDLARQALEITTAPSHTLEAVHKQRARFTALTTSSEYVKARMVADAWCAAFFWLKTRDGIPTPTTRTLLDISGDGNPLPANMEKEIVRLRRTYGFFHWHLEFPEIFTVNGDTNPSGYNGGPGWSGGFSCILGNPPWETLSPDTREFFSRSIPGIRGLSKAEKTQKINKLLEMESHRSEWNNHQRQLFSVAHFLKSSGRYFMYAKGNLGKGDFNVYRSFIELALTHTRQGGYAAQVAQSGLYSGANATAIREFLINECTWNAIYGFNNKGGVWFEDVSLENFSAYAAQTGAPSGENHEINAAFGLSSPDALFATLKENQLQLSVAELRSQNPETLAVPDIRDPRAARVSQKIYRIYPPFGTPAAGVPQRQLQREIDMSDKNGVFREDRQRGDDLPVYEGRMITFFDHRAKRYLHGHGNNSVWEETPFDHPSKGIYPQWYVSRKDLQNNEVRALTDLYRVGFMDVADPGRQRSFCSSLIPPHVVCGHKVPTIRFPDFDWYIPVYLGIANSLTIDFLARQRTMSKSMTFSILDSLPIARLPLQDSRSKWIAERCLRLICTDFDTRDFWNLMATYGYVEECGENTVPGETDEDRRMILKTELDAFVAQNVYGLTRKELELLLSTFTQLEGIEKKRYGTFRTKSLVLDIYDRMAEAQRTGTPYQTPLDPPPGHGPRHPA